ncbi:MAG: hypothetical protein NZL92_00090 [Gloeomargarita sp. SKYG116]|nr:hypothetical protein [Gloeomargarita sp. SKYG116]MCS7225948.1 hypothetical protein [Gloeomargarita sp. SKYB31]MDW8400076.1 SRPBCC family protein [Gloeomargarita sp. SKYGB_i_bin116]
MTRWRRRATQPKRIAVTYYALSNAPVEQIWQKLTNLADLSWHPLVTRPYVPWGLLPKPGLLYEAVFRLFPIRVRIFVERVQQQKLLSVRVFALPGVEERVTYQVQSTVCGTQISYSITLQGWLSPLVWSVIRPRAARVARQLAQAAEGRLTTPWDGMSVI